MSQLKFLNIFIALSVFINCQNSAMANNGLTEKQFEELSQKVEKFYKPIFFQKGFKFKVNRYWGNDAVFAEAIEDNNKKEITIFGGYARLKNMTQDVFLNILCHEVGHHLAGSPKKMNGWAAAEGASDYYSTLKCMRLLLKNDPLNKIIVSQIKLPDQIKNLCRKQFKNDDQFVICLRSAKVAEVYGNIYLQFDQFSQNKKSVSLLTPSQNKVDSINLYHPDAQCRVDTKLQGALCHVDENIPMQNDNQLAGVCDRRLNHKMGLRPKCWFSE